MAEVKTNLRVLQPSRKKLRAGDVFAMQMPDDLYLFGRVISTDAVSGFSFSASAILIYVFRTRSEVKAPPRREDLRPDNLLVPPILINRLPWSRGYFETIDHRPLEDDEVLAQNCFWDVALRGQYFDEKGHELPGPVEPVGRYGLNSYRTADDKISKALGFERVPD
jgi:hypothetical protein